MALFLASHWEDGWTVMEINGELDTTTAHQLRDFVAEVTGQHKHLNLIADLSELTYADVEGLSTLMSIRTLLHEDQGELRLVCPEGRVARILRTSKITRAMPFYPTLAAALAAPRSVPADRTGGAVP
ncbi:STAS domain-containing protein [Streptomyces sp. NPDC001816]|uniref:STAS domain-containing protein n=1 Tax=Streptomyces sp. NPDC001816 TaxID=3364612 RepID=UPI003685E840